MPVSSCCCAVPNKPATSADPLVIEALEERLNGNPERFTGSYYPGIF